MQEEEVPIEEGDDADEEGGSDEGEDEDGEEEIADAEEEEVRNVIFSCKTQLMTPHIFGRMIQTNRRRRK